MKIYMKILGIIALLLLEALSVYRYSELGLDTVFALWGGIYFILLYRQFVNFDRSPGSTVSEVLLKPHIREQKKGKPVKEKHHNSAVLTNMWMKLFYLTLTLGHIGTCYYLIKFPS